MIDVKGCFFGNLSTNSQRHRELLVSGIGYPSRQTREGIRRLLVGAGAYGAVAEYLVSPLFSRPVDTGFASNRWIDQENKAEARIHANARWHIPGRPP